jgi:hypothetical protein
MVLSAKKSESLTTDEFLKLKKLREAFDTEVDCAITIGIDRNVLSRVLMTKSGSQKTVGKIRIAISRIRG